MDRRTKIFLAIVFSGAALILIGGLVLRFESSWWPEYSYSVFLWLASIVILALFLQ